MHRGDAERVERRERDARDEQQQQRRLGADAERPDRRRRSAGRATAPRRRAAATSSAAAGAPSFHVEPQVAVVRERLRRGPDALVRAPPDDRRAETGARQRPRLDRAPRRCATR